MGEIKIPNLPDPERFTYEDENRFFQIGFADLVTRLGSKRAAIGFVQHAVPGLGESVILNWLDLLFNKRIPPENIRAKIIRAISGVSDVELNLFLDNHREFRSPIRPPLIPKLQKKKKTYD